MKKIRIKSKLILMISAVLISILSMTTISYFTSQDSVVNTINIGDVDIEVSEEFEPPTQNWDGSSWEKEVQIRNNSKSPALIRVALVPRWVDDQGNAWPGDTSIVTLNHVDVDNDEKKEDYIIYPPSITPQGRWTYGSEEYNDGYYYYNKIVPKGETTVKILHSVSVDIPDELEDRYKNKTLIVDVKAEAIQATTDAYTAAWSNIKDPKILTMLGDLCAR